MVRRSEHFTQRFGERVCSKTRRGQLLVERAFYFGLASERVKDARLRRYLHEVSESRRLAKAYKGQVYIFEGKTAITVFPLPNKLRGLA